MSREVGKPDATKKYVLFLTHHPYCAIVGVVLAAVIAAPFGLMVGGTATDDFSAVPHTKSFGEQNQIKANFPDVFDDQETIFFQCEGACPVAAFQPVLQAFADALLPERKDLTLVSVNSYYDAPVFLRPNYYNETAKSMLATLQFNSSKSSHVLDDAVTKMISTAAEQSTSKNGFTVGLSGQVATRLESGTDVGKVLGPAEGTGMIFIVLLFGWQCRSWRLVWIPLINTVLSLLICQGLVYPLSKSGAIILPSYVPEVCLFLSIALSVDYSFFHLSRFQEVRQEGKDVHEAVEEMVRTAGRVVLVSGVVLLFTWLALAAFPAFGTDALGYCSALTIFSCIVVNIIMNPAIILAFPNFYGRTRQDPWHCCRRRKTGEAGVGDAEVAEAERPLAEPTNDTAEIDNCYGAVAERITKMPGKIICPLIVYALLLPGAIRLFTVEFTTGVNGIAAGTSSTEQHILQDFSFSGGGIPLTLILTPPEGETIKSETYFQQGCALAKAVQETTKLPPSGFNGVMLKPSSEEIMCKSYAEAEQELSVNTEQMVYFWGLSANPGNTSSLIAVNLPFDAFGEQGTALVGTSRDGVATFDRNANYGTAAAFLPMAVEVDAENQTIGRLPWVVLATIVIVFSVIALRYGAAMVPLKLFMTIALPIVSTLGTTVFVFQDGILNWTGIPSLQSTGGIVWIMPVATTFMLIGFALDYDIFLFSRVYADRKSGLFLEDRPAVIHAVAKTGPVISTAGTIMAFAFCGMVVQSSNVFLSQMGFTMIYGILMDTFVVRTFLVPAFLTLAAGPVNWWPGTMPSKPPAPPAGFGSQLASHEDGDVVLA